MLTYIATIIATVIVSSSIGLLVGGLLSASKVSYLTDKLDQAHMILNFQMKVIEDLSATARKVLETIDGQPSNSLKSETMARLQLALMESDKAITNANSIKS